MALLLTAVPRRLLHLRRSWRDERGAVMVIAAGIMVAMLGMAALAIDLGLLYQNQRQVQSAADAAALAGVADLPGSQANAKIDAQSYAAKNLPGATVPAPTFPTSTEIKVVVTKVSPSFFAKVFGINSTTISATAVAQVTTGVTSCSAPGSTCYAMFAMDTACGTDPITLGGGTAVTGGLWSNGSINVGGGGSTLGPTTYGNGSGCTVIGGATYTSGPTARAPVLTWPVDYSVDMPACVGAACTGPLGTPSFCTKASTAASESLISGSTLASGNIYCDVGTGTAATPTTWNGAISVAASSPITASFVGGSVTVGGGSQLTACGYSTSGYAVASCSASVPAPATTNYPLAYAVGSGTAFNDSSGGVTVHGDVFAPNGTIVLGGGGQTTFVEGKDITATAGGTAITGDGPTTAGTTPGPAGSNSLTQ